MKRSFIILNALLFSAACLFSTGCTDEDGGEVIYQPGDPQPSVEIMLAELAEEDSEARPNPGTDYIDVVFMPNAHTSRVEYFIGTEDDYEAFRNGTAEGVESQEGGDDFQVSFEGLTPATDYVVFAYAYDEADNRSALASRVIPTKAEGVEYIGAFDVSAQFVGDRSAAVVVEGSSETLRYEYYLGTTQDREAFEDGTLEGIQVKAENMKYTMTYFDLEPETEYVFFARGYNRYGQDTGVIEYIVETPAATECPSYTFHIDNIDVYRGDYRFELNSLCSKIVVVISTPGQYDYDYYESTNSGDVRGAIQRWVDLQVWGRYVESTGPSFETSYVTDVRQVDRELEIHVLMYDQEGEPFGVIRENVKTPSYTSGLGSATVTVTPGTVTSSDITYTIEANSATLGYVYSVIPSYTIDGLTVNAENMQSLMLYKTWAYMPETDNPATFTTSLPYNYVDKRHFLIVYPMNANGVSGWGDYYIHEFTAP